MRILFAASEAAPFAKTGGLADVVGSLPPAIASLGHEVSVVMPRYRQVDIHALKLKQVTTFTVPLGTWKERCDVLKGTMGNYVTVYFINKDVFYDRPELYGTTHGDYSDNAQRFIFFSRAVLELCNAVQIKPDIIHCNDWQTGLVPLYLKKLYSSAETLRNTKTVFTVHNLGYQGLFWHWDMRLTGLDWNVFTPEGIEFWGKMNLLKAGLVSADIITTVSKTYSREIQTPEYGCGLEGILKKRSADLYGIVNGIDHKTYDPLHDHEIPYRYSASHLSGKTGCKKKLLELVNLPDRGAPLIGMVTRLVDQKGMDILTDALPDIMSLGVQLIILGSGDAAYHRLLADAASQSGNAMRVLLLYDEVLAKNIYSGSDMFLMPSRYEPCGLGQMIALRYGTVPIVRRTGGLSDTVVDCSSRADRGTGFLFGEYSAPALLNCIRRALKVFSNKAKWHRLMKAGMNVDFSWEHSAKEYVKLYQKAMKKDRV
jgi:starch synthase